MSEQTNTKNVTFNYTVKLTDGTVLESTVEGNPITIQLGSLQILPVIEESMSDKKDGDKYTLNVSKENAYGEVIPQLIEKVELERIPSDAVVGAELRGRTPDNQEFIAFVEEINESEKFAVINANHPLAGKDLIFDIEIVTIG